jgi:anti-sigma regulatory factor (Ser/Thr protein kinase)
MTTTTTHATGSFGHELVLHDGPGELIDLMVPFLQDGADAGDLLVVLGEPDFVDTLLAAVPGVGSVEVLAEPDDVRSPGRDLHRFQQILSRAERSGHRVRVANKMPTASAAGWHEWRRYEAAVNVVLAGYPVWGRCVYDLAAVDAAMLRDLTASHPFVLTTGGRRRSEDFDEQDAGARDYLHVPPHPVESTEPTLSIVDPTAAAARRAVRDLALASGLSQPAQEAIIFATSEAVTNGWTHGQPPVRVRVWAGEPGSMTVSVSDSGHGPHPLVGLVAAEPHGLTGHGLWLVHLLLGDIHHRSSEDGYTVTFGVDGGTGHPSVRS